MSPGPDESYDGSNIPDGGVAAEDPVARMIRKKTEALHRVVTQIDKPKTHRIKSWTQFFWAIKAGIKLHDLRKNDRDYRVGDTVVLAEYDMIKGAFTGETVTAEITFITSSQFPCAFSSAVLPADYAILSLKVKP